MLRGIILIAGVWKNTGKHLKAFYSVKSIVRKYSNLGDKFNSTTTNIYMYKIHINIYVLSSGNRILYVIQNYAFHPGQMLQPLR